MGNPMRAIFLAKFLAIPINIVMGSIAILLSKNQNGVHQNNSPEESQE
jgi:hypothetical protein